MTDNQVNKSTVKINEATFKQMYQLYWGKVYAVCYNNIRETEVSKGMVQEIFKSLWERRDELEIDTSVERYLLRSAKFKVFEYLRNAKSRRQHTEEALWGLCNAEYCTENEVMFNSLKSKVDLLVDSLPCQCRNVYRMSREQGLSNKEIAASLRVSERAVEYHITRALTTLRAHLTEYVN